jgi:tRNA dimethylallyltransferase
MPPASLDLSKPPLVTLIAGPTASGKSALALKMARETGAVIINADSQQLYADLRILTARPSPEDEAQAEHRLYGVADAAEAWSVGKWIRAALAILAFTALTRGLADIPPVASAVRDQVEADFLVQGEALFRTRLAEIDPAAAQAIEAGDRQRLVRAMSVHAATGRPLTAWKSQTQPLLAPESWTGLVIEPDRQVLYADCDRRADLMVENDALDEVRRLVARDLSPALPAMKAVGVRELAAYVSGALDREAAVAALKQATRNYAKRQLTWFRNQCRDWSRIPRP